MKKKSFYITAIASISALSFAISPITHLQTSVSLHPKYIMRAMEVEEPILTSLFISYTGEVLTAPATLTKDNFIVTGVQEDGTQITITDYTFTSSLEVKTPGETVISVAYAGQTASCSVSYIEPVTKNYFTVTLDTAGGDILPPITAIAPSTSIGKLPTPVRSGYWFRGWYTDAEHKNEYNETQLITKDTTFYANWEAKEFPNSNIMTSTFSTGSFNCLLKVDLTNQTYGYHTKPTTEYCSQEEIASTVENICKTNNYFAFRFDVEELAFKSQYPLSTTVTVPSSYDMERVRIYYTPDEKQIQGLCQGASISSTEYNFSAYAPGTYIVIELTPEALSNTVTVTEPPAPTATVVPSISIAAAETVTVNAQIAAQLNYHDFDELENNPEEIPFTWSSNNEKIATISQEGIVTGISPGVVTITATSSNSLYSASKQITVQPKPVKIKTLVLNKNAITLKKGKSFSIKATITPKKAANQKLKYSSTNKKIATVTAKGKIKAKKKGSCIIKVKTSDGSKITKKIKVVVK